MKKIMALLFIKGLDLCQQFFEQAVRPILTAHFPRLQYAAGRLGGGSDVLGFDTPLSRDHDWGPRMTLFLSEADFTSLASDIEAVLQQELPPTFQGYPTHYGYHADGTLDLQFHEQGPLNHMVQCTTAARFLEAYLGLALHQEPPPAGWPEPAEWLLIPWQHLATVRHGRLFFDSLGSMTAVRQALHFFPHDLWLYLLAGQWTRLGQEAVFVSRTGDTGDEPGSRLIAARQVHDMMRLAFLLSKEYAPYSKWLGSAFARLRCATDLLPIFDRVWQANGWRAREAALNEGYLYLARWHNSLKLTEPLPTEVDFFHERPYRILDCDPITAALYNQIQNPQIRALPRGLGSLDQISDATDLLSYPKRWSKIKALYGPGDPYTPA